MVLAPWNSIAVVTRCSDKRSHLKFGAVVKLFNKRSLYSWIYSLWFVVLMYSVLFLNTVNMCAARELL